MSTFTGRAPSGRVSRIGKGLLDGLVTMSDALHDGGLRTQIEDIDGQIEVLRRERDSLISRLYEPGDLKVSDDFDPTWRKPETTPTPSGPGRLTQCAGREYMGVYHGAHPGCPYIDSIHKAHDFTLRD